MTRVWRTPRASCCSSASSGVASLLLATIVLTQRAAAAAAHVLFSRSRVHRLPVVDAEGRCVAMITRTDVFRPLIPEALADPLYLQKVRSLSRHPPPAWEGRDVAPSVGRDLPAV
jgi:hypothetical protein